MKKFLLGALLVCGVIAQAQTYVATSFVGYDLGEDYTFASGESWSQDDDEAWEVTFTADGDNYVIANLLGWDETVNGVFNPETDCITIAGATEVQDGYCICGGFSGYLTAQAIMDLCDQYGSYVPAWTPKNVVLKFDENGNIVAQTPIFYTMPTTRLPAIWAMPMRWSTALRSPPRLPRVLQALGTQMLSPTMPSATATNLMAATPTTSATPRLGT